MSTKTQVHPNFRKHLLALAVSAVLAPNGAWAIDLAQSPPGTTEPYVAPNVIISIDDSGSMNYQITNSNTGNNVTAPNADGSWDPKAKRINVLKYALTQTFNDTTLLPDRKIRLAWQAMWNNGNSPGVGSYGANSVDSATKGVNSMDYLAGTATTAGHRKDFLDFVSKLTPSNGTPSHQMFRSADHYMRRALSSNGPWSSNPGGSDAASTTYLGCRRNYQIFFTDGRWNGTVSGGSQDDNTTNITLPDGTVYGSTSAASRPNTQLYSDPYANMLADWAFYSWSTPLQTSGLTGAPQPNADYRKAPATETFGTDSAGKPATLSRYWNPRYDPATWPHLVTYTIGISNDGTTWPNLPGSAIIAPTQKVPFGYDNSFLNLVTGTQKWPDLANTGYVDSQNNDRALDLWHAALNGRGHFYAVMSAADLETAFRDIIGTINTQTDPDMTSTATSGSNNMVNQVGKYTGAYEPSNAWKGYITADVVKKDGTTAPDPNWAGQTTADKLDDPSFNVANRVVWSWSDTWTGTAPKGGVSFKWASDETYLSTAQKALIGLDPSATGVTVATNGQNRVNYVRGDHSLEGVDPSGYTSAKPFRQRKSREGDIVDSVVWYTGAPASNYSLTGYASFTTAQAARPAMLYVGGNDGMLHGFAALDGTEKLAYVPRGVISNLPLLTDPTYNSNHRYFVDGSPMTGDVGLRTTPTAPDASTDTVDWHTMLVGTLGAGGKGYFVLDVTDPASSFIESNAKQLVTLDRTRGSSEVAPNCAAMSGVQQTACLQTVAEDKDIGNITVQPVLDDTNPMRTTQITRLNNNRWAAVLGNGYNSANQRPVLLIQYLDGNKELLRIPATTDATGTGNAADNGLSAPRLVDINGDGIPDVAYAGDNLGNMWKFDLTNISDTNWGVAFGGQPLFTARGPASLGSTSRLNIQPITAAPTVRTNDRTMTVGTGPSAKTVAVGGMMVAFGTGRNTAQSDQNSVQVQTLYSVLDNTHYNIVSTTLGQRLAVNPGAGTCTPVPAANCVPAPTALGVGVTNAKLAAQTITELSGGAFGTVDVSSTTNDLNKGTWANFNGWYLDFPAVGERLLKPMQFYDGSNILAVYSQVPAKGSNVDPTVESCQSTSVDEERQFRTLVNIMDGKRPTVQLVDMNGDGLYNAADANVSRVQVSKGSHTMITQRNSVMDIDSKNQKELLARMPEQSLRPSWRQVK